MIVIMEHALNQVKFIQRFLSSKYFERDEIIFCSLVSMIASEHMLLIGPPGAGKSSVLDDICNYIRGIEFFKWTMTNETKTDELLGPYDKSQYDYGILKRITDNKLPEAHIALLDETLRAKGDTLNSLLTILNERTFMQESKPVPVPLVSLFGATNDYPEDETIEALYDRFLIRIRVDYIKERDNLTSLLLAERTIADDDLGSLSLDDLKRLKLLSRGVEIPEDIISVLVDIREKLFKQNIKPSDRRLKSSLNLLKASAMLNNRQKVEYSDLTLLRHVLWLKKQDQQVVSELIDNFVTK